MLFLGGGPGKRHPRVCVFRFCLQHKLLAASLDKSGLLFPIVQSWWTAGFERSVVQSPPIANLLDKRARAVEPQAGEAPDRSAVSPPPMSLFSPQGRVDGKKTRERHINRNGLLLWFPFCDPATSRVQTKANSGPQPAVRRVARGASATRVRMSRRTRCWQIPGSTSAAAKAIGSR